MLDTQSGRNVVTLRDIADRAGISRTTVSLILNHRGRERRISDATCRRVQALAQSLGYRRNEIARSVVAGRTNIIGFVAPSTASQHCALMLDGVLRAANRLGVMVKVLSVGDPAEMEQAIDRCRGYRLAGLIAYEMSGPTCFADMRRRLARHGMPTVIAAGDSRPGGLGIYGDNLGGGRLAFEHLWSRGHRRSILVANHARNPWSADRTLGFRRAAADAGLAFPARQRLETPGIGLPDAGALLRRLRATRATAVFCVSDYAALSVVGALQGAGIRVPDDVAVVGYGNLPFCTFMRPTLTSIDEHLGRTGSRAVDLLMAEIGRSQAPSGAASRASRERAEVDLVIRDSTGGQDVARPEISAKGNAS